MRMQHTTFWHQVLPRIYQNKMFPSSLRSMGPGKRKDSAIRVSLIYSKIGSIGHLCIFEHSRISLTRWGRSRFSLVVTDRWESLLQVTNKKKQLLDYPKSIDMGMYECTRVSVFYLSYPKFIFKLSLHCCC